jgi:hypothetical protein
MNVFSSGAPSRPGLGRSQKCAILILYFAVTLSVTLAHAMWRDELQAWLVARDSGDLSQLFHNLHYEGHAALWYLLLMPLTRISPDPVMMQLIHVAIATSTIALMLWRAPLSRLEQVLFPFGYFFFFEYAVKSRGYALGSLIVFLLCAFWTRRRRSPVVMALLLALMANVDILFMILSMAAVLALVVDRFIGAPPVGEAPRAGRRSEVMALAIVGAGWVLAVATTVPPSDSDFAVGWLYHWSAPRAEMALAALGVLFTSERFLACLATCAVLLVAAIRSRGSLPAATLLFASVLGLVTFFYVKYPGAIRHHGLIFIAVTAAVWIDRVGRRVSISAATSRDKPLLPALLFNLILAFQVFGGVAALWTDLHRPLSHGREVARFISARGWNADPIVCFPDKAGVTVIGYLGVKQAYFPQGHRWGSFTIWDKRRTEPVNFDRTFADIGRLRSPATWVSELSVDDPALMRKYGFVEVARFTGAEIENFVVYRRASV